MQKASWSWVAYYIQIVLSSVFLTIRCMGVRSYVQDSENITNYAYSSLYFCFCRQLRYIKESALLRKSPTSKNFLKDPLNLKHTCIWDLLIRNLIWLWQQSNEIHMKKYISNSM